MLFSSKRQLQELVEALEPAYESRLLVQGQMSKADILQEHRRRIDRGDSSIIFGLASFAEGVDLPGDYCSHVIIAKLPFAAPDDPSMLRMRNSWRPLDAIHLWSLPCLQLRDYSKLAVDCFAPKRMKVLLRSGSANHHEAIRTRDYGCLAPI